MRAAQEARGPRTCAQVVPHEVRAGRVGDQVPHERQLDARRRQQERGQREHDQPPAAQRAGQEAAPERVRQAEEGAEELVGGAQVQAGQQLHAKHVEGGLWPACSDCKA